ncbi:macrophage mannose receptor 1-like [Anoplopoma fimbria]|uniref:macrophage mannose receptor 1-like n=1 Tax=Anoplopoma fimbria TaxID=229290 RepID=UPI0023ED498B|nr:macrophage mannose receptor 1-like [Anoplopoma fimbria]
MTRWDVTVLSRLPFHNHHTALASLARNAWIKSSAVGHFRQIPTMKITCSAFVLLIKTLQCLASDDSPFQLTNKDTGFCLVKTNNNCNDLRWTTSDRLLVPERKKCLGVQGKSVGSEINLYDCDEHSDLQKWECKNQTVLALKDQELYIELTADTTAVLSKTIGPNNHLTISGTSNGACARTYRELYAIGGNAAGLPCMFPFQYGGQWYSDCTMVDSTETPLWCAVETKYQSERWGYCPSTSKEGWTIHPTTGAYYQLNTQSALTWNEAEVNCKQQGASLLSITDPHQQAYVTALLGTRGNKLWTGLVLNPEHGWKWSNGRPYRYLKWDSGHPLPISGHNCAIVDPAVQYSWQSSPCSKKLGYICYSEAAEVLPAQDGVTGFCSRPWIYYTGHCFHLNRNEKTWSDAQRECRNEGGDLVSISNVEDQSFVISQLGYISMDELWIGLNDRKTEGLFDWIDHSTVRFTSWEYGKPAASSDIKDCVVIMGENGNWADRVCEEKHGSICMKMSASKPTGDEVQQDVGCKTGWKRHGSYCYFIGIQTKTFNEAKEDCKSSDSYLADVSNRVDNAFLVSFVGWRPDKYFWLGLSNQKNIARFAWTNRESVSFTHWNAKMPGHRQGCVAMTTGFLAGLWDVLPCTNKEKYVCKHLVEGVVLTTAPTSFHPTMCANTWKPIGLRNDCYKLFSPQPSKKRTWYEARDYCKAIGGDLISIHSADELLTLPNNNQKAWIGLSAPDSGTGYVWSDGSPLQFQDWDDGEPNNKNNVESCTEFWMTHERMSGSWNDVQCEKYHSWLCQIRAGVTPNPTPDPVAPDYNRTSDGWLEWNGAQYYFNKQSMAMEEARSFCLQKHSDLVVINSEAERVFLWKQVSRSSGSYWIGLNVDLDKTYDWMDGSPVVFQRWDENQPLFLRNDENCAVMTEYTGFWHVYNCGYECYSICKRSGSPPANATIAPTVPPKGGCPQNWKQFDSKCYSIINNQKETWHGARTQCKAMGGNLATIPSRQVQLFLNAELAEAPATYLWIGLYRFGNPSYLWTDGKPSGYGNWGNGRPFYIDHESDFLHYFFSPRGREKVCVLMTGNPNFGIGKWFAQSCNDTNGYVCLRNVDPSLPDSPESTATDYVKIFNDSIKLVSQQMNWDAAQKHCESEGAKLASLRNQWSLNYAELLALTVKSPVWIGLNKMETGGYFRYIDGWHITVTNWGRQEPNTYRPCVFVDVDGTWKTADCDQTMNSICMKSTDVAPTESSSFPGFCPDDIDQKTKKWLPFRGYCYLFFTKRVEWPEASVQCVIHGGNLASIEDPSEQAFIQSNIEIFQDNELSFWIGLYKTHRGIWQWLDKTAVDYTYWNRDQTDSTGYGSIRATDGKWMTGNGWYERGYICKTPKILRRAPQTSVNPTVDPQSHSHNILAGVLVITLIAIGTVIALFLFKKSGRRLPIPEKLSTFDNPTFNDVVDPNKLVANAEEENPGPDRAV